MFAGIKLILVAAFVVTLGLALRSLFSRQPVQQTAGAAMAANGATAASDVVHLSDTDDHKAEVEDSKIPVLIDFYATWCPPCQALTPHIEAVAKQYKGKVKVVKVDVDKNPALKRKYGVRYMPTLVIVLPGGKGQVKDVGYKDLSDLKKWIDDNAK